MNDLRYAVRQMRRSPGVSGAALVTMALGIGACTALFTVVNSILIRPLPYPDPDRLALLYSSYPDTQSDHGTVSKPDLEDWTARNRTFSAMGLYSTAPSRLVLQSEAGASELRTVYVNAGFFPTMAVEPLYGRVFSREDETGDPFAVVVSYGFWQRQLGGDTTAFGKSLTLSDRSFRVVGVMPPGFGFPNDEAEVWTLFSIIRPQEVPLHIREVRFLRAVGRMRPGVTPEQAIADLSAVARGLAEEHPESNARLLAVNVAPLRQEVVGRVRAGLLVLFGAVGMVLLIACANVANLLLARGAARGRELAIRTATGAGRGRLARLLLTESLVIALVGGAAGWLLAIWGVDLLASRSAGVLPRLGEIQPDLTVLGFALAASLVAVVLSGVVPALALTRTDPAEQLKQSGRVAGGRAWGARGLVTAEVAVAVVLLVGAGLLLRSFYQLQHVDPGFDAERTLSVTMTLPASRYPNRPDFLGMHERLLNRFANLPGVEAAGSIRSAPTLGAGEQVPWEAAERPAATPDDRATADLLQVTPDLFRAMGVRLVSGRTFTTTDGATDRVVVVNQALARAAFGERDAVGQAIRLQGTDLRVIGVVGDIRQRGPDTPVQPTIFVTNALIPRRGMAFMLRTSGDPLDLIGPVQAAVRGIDPALAITDMSSLDALVGRSVGQPRFFTLLLSSFATLALVLAAIGIYGVLAFTVRQRTREIGIRATLGETRGRILAMVVRQGMRPVLLGFGIGLAAATFLTRFLQRLLFDLKPLDPATYAAAILLLAFVALTACLIPGRRASQIHPMEALRYD